MKECLKKRGLDIRQARRIVQDRSEWRGFVREMNPRPSRYAIVVGFHTSMMLLGGNMSVAEPTT